MKASVVAELLEQEYMASQRGKTIDGYFPLNYRTITDRLFIPHNVTRKTMNELLEKGIYSSKRIGNPSSTYYKMDILRFLESFVPGLVAECQKTSINQQSMNSSSIKSMKDSSTIIRTKKEDLKTKKEDAKASCAGAPSVAVRPVLIKRKQTLQDQVVESAFKNENIAEIFRYYCGKGCLPSHKVDSSSKTFKECQKRIAKALRTHSKPVIKQAIDDYCLMLTDAGFKLSPKYDKTSLPNFFLFDEHKERAHRSSIDKSYMDVTSWFDECVMGLPYLTKKFGNGMSEIDPYPDVTAALIKQFNKRQEDILGGTISDATDDKYFVKAAKIVVDFYDRHKNKIIWGSKLRASRNVKFFAPMMIDARYHFSQDNVTMVKPTWFSSDKAITFLVDYLLAKGMIDRSKKQQILANRKDDPKNNLILRNAENNRRESMLRRRAERIAEEND